MFNPAEWHINDLENSISIQYKNNMTNVVFDCGTIPKDTEIEKIMTFILTDGDSGDVVFRNDQIIYIIDNRMVA